MKLLFIAAFIVLAMSLTFIGTASAKYVGDNAVPDGVGGWALPADKGFCNTGIKRDGTMLFDLAVGNNRNDCLAKIFPAYTTQSTCLLADKAGANAEGSHFWASTCISNADPNVAISLSGLDRTRFMCEQNGGTWKQACTSNWTAMGPTWSASPVSPTTGGTDGFCYTSIRVNDVFANLAACQAVAGSCNITAVKRENIPAVGGDNDGVCEPGETCVTLSPGDVITSLATCEAAEDVAAAGGNDDGICNPGETCGVWNSAGQVFGYSVATTGTCAGAGATTQTSRSACEGRAITGSGDGDTVCEDGETCGVWTVGTPNCLYAYGTVGVANAALNFKDGQAPAYAAAGSTVTLTGLTQGQCLANGASFSNHTTAGGFVALGVSTIASPITQVRAGCLSCHNNTTQYNSMSGRWKSDYLKQGHKNMLRKVTPGIPWAGADGVVFTQAAASSVEVMGDGLGDEDGQCETGEPCTPAQIQDLNFAAGTATGSYGTRELMYIFGDWMAPAPDGLDTIVWRDDLASPQARYNGNGSYSCGACHATGWSGPVGSGVCVVGNVARPTSGTGAVTTKAACDAIPGIFYFSSGEQSDAAGNFLGTYQPVEPGASFPAHAIAGNFIPGIVGRWDHDGINCNRCHKVAYDPSFPINDEGVSAPNGFTTHETDIFDGWKCTQTCFGCHQSPPVANNGTGNAGVNNVDLDNPQRLQVKNVATAPAYKPEFNSHPIGNMFLNSPHAKFTGTTLPNKVGKFDIVSGSNASHFVGKLCRSSTAPAGGNILETQANGEVIKTLEECNIANGKAVGDATDYGFWQNESGDEATQFEGSCITCHNVHESLFVADAKEPLRRECTTCHTTKNDGIKHPIGTGTPFDTNLYVSSCETCHMPKATDGGFPMHLWRINSSASYSTFPTSAQFLGNTKKIANAAPDGTYAEAVWVDVDYACGQCHGGGTDQGTNPAKPGIMWFDKSTLAVYAAGMHLAGDLAPTASHTTAVTDLTVTLVDTSSDNNFKPQSSLIVTVNWGDNANNSVQSLPGGSTFTHTYASPGTYNILYSVKESGGKYAYANEQVKVAAPGAVTLKNAITVHVMNNAAAPVAGATVYLKKQQADGSFIQVKYGYTDATGTATFQGGTGKTFKIVVYKSSMDFDGSVLGKQTKVKTGAFVLGADLSFTITQGTAATNGPAGKEWKGDNGGAPSIF